LGLEFVNQFCVGRATLGLSPLQFFPSPALEFGAAQFFASILDV
jgi:hypothetical protein